MITCAHCTPERVPYELRQGFEALARQVSLQWTAMDRIAHLGERERLRGIRQKLIDRLRGVQPVGDALTGGEISVTDLIASDGAAVRIEGRSFIVGDALDSAQAAGFYAYLDLAREKYFVSEAVTADRPEVAELLPSWRVSWPCGSAPGATTWRGSAGSK